MRNIEDVGAKLLGVILTVMPTRSGGYYGRYSYYGGYGEEAPTSSKALPLSSDRLQTKINAHDETIIETRTD